MEISLEEIEKIKSRIDEINDIPSSLITFTRNGQRVDLPEELIIAMYESGLTNFFWAQNILEEEAL